MLPQVRWLSAGLILLAAVVCLFPGGSAARGGDKDEMVENPFFKFWSGSKKGSTSVYLERNKVGGPDSKTVLDGYEEKRIAYKLLEVTDEKVVVETTVTEKEFFGQIQTAPTRHIYPAKIKKELLERFLQQAGVKTSEDTVKFKDKEMKCRKLTGKLKAPTGEETAYEIWLSDEVPGSIVKQIRTTKSKGEVVAVTTITLEAYNKNIKKTK